MALVNTRILIASCLGSIGGIPKYSSTLNRFFNVSNGCSMLLRKDQDADHTVLTYQHRSFRGLRDYIAPYYLSKAIKTIWSEVIHLDYVDGATALKWSGYKPKHVVVTAHDAIPYIYPHKLAPANWYYKMHIKNTLKVADRVIVVSESAKHDFVRFTGIEPERVKVIYNGIDHDAYRPPVKKIRNKTFTIRYVGGLTAPHKNVMSILRTAKLLMDMGITVKFELAGGAHPDMPVFKEYKTMGLNNVVFKGFIPDEELPAFYQGADLFIYPSLYEGFGFPPLEAMACGVPVLSSNRGSLKEVLGQGAITLDPKPENFADVIASMLNNRQSLVDLGVAGRHTALQYTWEKCAEETLKCYGI